MPPKPTPAAKAVEPRAVGIDPDGPTPVLQTLRSELWNVRGRVRALEAELAQSELRAKGIRLGNLILLRDIEAADARVRELEAELDKSRSNHAEAFRLGTVARGKLSLEEQNAMLWQQRAESAEARIRELEAALGEKEV